MGTVVLQQNMAMCSSTGDENTCNPAMPFPGIHHGMCTRRQVQGCLLLWQGKKKVGGGVKL